MNAYRRHIAPAALLLASMLWPSPSGAETFLDLYLGQARTGASSVTVTHQPFFGPTETATRRVSFDSSGEFGIRGVMWNALQPGHGFGMGVSYFEASGAGVEIDVFAYSFMYMGRMRMHVSERFKTGRLQPYLGLGLLVLDATGEFDFSPEVSERVSASGSGMGTDLRVGIRWLTSESGAVLAEMRQTSASPDMETLTWGDGADTASVNLRTTHLYLGFSVRF